MKGKTALHLAATRGESREETEREQDGTMKEENGGNDSSSPCCSKR
jgi:hypothetical protein